MKFTNFIVEKNRRVYKISDPILQNQILYFLLKPKF